MNHRPREKVTRHIGKPNSNLSLHDNRKPPDDTSGSHSYADPTVQRRDDITVNSMKLIGCHIVCKSAK